MQAAGSDYLWQAFTKGEDVANKPAIAAETVADSISADLPRDRVKALAAAVETGGAYVRVDDDEILAAIPELAAGAGVFAEPAAAAAFAGLRRAVKEGLIGGDDRVVVIATGSGLKDVPAANRAVADAGMLPLRVDPDESSLDQLAEWNEP